MVFEGVVLGAVVWGCRAVGHNAPPPPSPPPHLYNRLKCGLEFALANFIFEVVPLMFVG